MMNFNRLIFWLTVLLIFIMAARISIDSDTWWHLRAGAWIVEHRQLPISDPFSFTRQNIEWRYPGWLVEVPMYWIYSRFGPGGLNLWTALLIAITFGFVYQTADGKPLLRAFVIILAAIASAVYWSARPHLVTLLFTSITIFILEHENRHPNKQTLRWVAIGLPLIMLIWVNCHGGFLIGFIIWGIYLTGTGILILRERLLFQAENQEQLAFEARESTNTVNRIKGLLIAGIGMFLLGMVNPLGLKIYLYPFQTVTIKSLQNFIEEWQSPNFHWISTQPFIWLLILLISGLGLSHKKLKFTDFILISIFLYLALLAGRNLALFAVVISPLILRYLNEIQLPRTDISGYLRLTQRNVVFSRRAQNLINWGILGFVLFGAIVKVYLIFPASVNEKAFQSLFPVNAVLQIKKIPSDGQLFNSYNWGGYLLWALPERKVFIDGRTDLYNDEIIEDWLQVVQLKTGWEDVLKKWNIESILMEKDWSGKQLLQSRGWCLVYQDEMAILLQRCQ